MQLYHIILGSHYDLQVIEEIEEIMQDSPEMQAEQNPIQSNLIHRSTSHSYKESKCQNTGLIVLHLHYRVSLLVMLRFV